jgi:hypothetical protein
MNTEQNKSKIHVPSISGKNEQLIKVAGTTILILFGTFLVVKISKEILKELEGMGL